MTLVSCKQRREAIRQLGCAQAIMETAPDSALVFLDSIRSHPGVLDKRHRMEYETAMVQAKYKCYKDISEDTAVFEARRYFVKTKDYGQQALAALYSGCVYEERGEYEMSMEAYKEAMKPATIVGDSLIMARIQQCIGSLLYSHGLYGEALKSYKKAAEICRSMPEKQAEYYGNIGRCFVLMKENDSAFYYYKKGIDCAIQIGNIEIQSILLQNLSVLYRECQMYDEALSTLRQSLRLNPIMEEYPYYNLNFARLYNLLNQNDSLTYYISLLKNDLECIEDRPLLTSIYSILSEYEMQKNNYDSAFYYQTKYSDMIEDIYQEQMEQSVYEIQQKYDYQKKENFYAKKLLKRQIWITLLVLFLLIALMVVVIMIYKILKRKEHEAEINKKLLALQKKTDEAKIKYTQKEYEFQQYNEKKEQDELMLRFLMIMYSESLCDSNKNVINNLKKLLYGDNEQDNWEAMLSIFDRLFPGRIDMIKAQYQDLNEMEFKICILSHFDLSRQEEADFMHCSVYGMDKYRWKLYDKMKKQTIIPCKSRKKVCKKRLVFYTYNIYNQHFKYKTVLKKVCKAFLILFF